LKPWRRDLQDPDPKSRQETGMVEKDRTVVVAECIELVVGRCSWGRVRVYSISWE
jgi:hypothetical protein